MALFDQHPNLTDYSPLLSPPLPGDKSSLDVFFPMQAGWWWWWWSWPSWLLCELLKQTVFLICVFQTDGDFPCLPLQSLSFIKYLFKGYAAVLGRDHQYLWLWPMSLWFVSLWLQSSHQRRHHVSSIHHIWRSPWRLFWKWTAYQVLNWGRATDPSQSLN